MSVQVARTAKRQAAGALACSCTSWPGQAVGGMAGYRGRRSAPTFRAQRQFAGLGDGLDLGNLTQEVVKGATDYYTAQQAVQTAKYTAQLAKAQAQAAINVAKAGGQNAASTAAIGLPSPSLLLVAGLGLAALLILKK